MAQEIFFTAEHFLKKEYFFSAENVVEVTECRSFERWHLHDLDGTKT